MKTLLPFTLCVVLALSSASSAWEAQQLTDNSYDDWGAPSDGVNIVWSTDNGEVVIHNGVTAQVIYTDTSRHPYSPEVSEGNVVWHTAPPPGSTANPAAKEIFWYNGTTVERLTNNDYSDTDCHISGTNIVWSGAIVPGGSWGIHEIFYFDGVTTTRLTNNDRPEGFPQISGNQIVWERTETSGFENIYSYDGSTITQLTDTLYSENRPDISGQYTTWEDPDGYIVQNDGTTTKTISGYSYDHRSAQADGDRVAWYSATPSGGFNIFYYDGSTTTQVTSTTTDGIYVRLSGEKLVWQETVNGYWQIFLYDGQIHQLTNGQLHSQYPEISGDLVTWMTDDGNDYEVYKMVVPEPATLSLLALGGLALLRRKRKQGKMRDRTNCPRVLFVMALALGAAWSPVRAYAAVWTITQLTDNGYDDEGPLVSGSHVKWDGNGNLDPDDPTTDYEIFLYDGSSTAQLTDNTYDDRYGFVSGSCVTWAGNGNLDPNDPTSDREIFYYDGASVTQLTTNSHDDHGPGICGRYVRWQGLPGGGDKEIFLRDASDPNSPIEQLTNNTHDDDVGGIGGSWFSWYGTDGPNVHIWYHDIITGITTQVTDNNYIDKSPDTDGSSIVWERTGEAGDDYEVMLYDGETTARLTDNPHHDHGAKVFGTKVAWYGHDGNDYEIFLYDITTGTTERLTDNTYDDLELDIEGSQVVWYGYDGNDFEVFVYDIISEVSTQLTDNSYDDWFPNTDGSAIVWYGYDGNDWEIFMAVPEPATMSLLALGACLPLFRRKRR